MSAPEPVGRLRAYWQFLLAVFYFFLARSLAHHAAMGLAADQWVPLVEQAILAFLLVMGYAALGFWLNRQLHPIAVQGLPRRQGWQGEVGLGLATGWGLALVCVLLLALGGGIAISISTRASAWGWLLADAAFFALAALAEEIAFRGYGFQRFVDAVGPIGASTRIRRLLRHRAVSGTGVGPRQHHGLQWLSDCCFPRPTYGPRRSGSAGGSTLAGRPAAPCSSGSP